MTVAIVKVRLLSGNIKNDSSFALSSASRINEQLAFMSAWDLLIVFVKLDRKEQNIFKEVEKRC